MGNTFKEREERCENLKAQWIALYRLYDADIRHAKNAYETAVGLFATEEKLQRNVEALTANLLNAGFDQADIDAALGEKEVA